MSRRPSDPVTAYAKGVVSGKIIAGRMVRLACQRHLDDLEHGHERGLTWDPKAAQHVIDFFEQFLVLPDGPKAGEPFTLQGWAVFAVGSLHGWWDRDGFRRFKEAYIETGKGSAKTPVGAGLCAYAIVADAISGAQAYVAASTREHAKTPFRDCERVLGPDLKDRMEVLRDNIRYPATDAFIRPVSSEAGNLEGGRVHFAFMDEVGLHKNGDVIMSMRRGTKGNRNALLFMITNSGDDRESICWEYHEKSRKLLDGELEDDELFAYVCQLDPCEACRSAGHEEPQVGCPRCDDWRDEKCWPKTNPLLGVTIPYSYLRKEVKGALEIPSTESSVRRYNFCAWLSSDLKWFTADQWGACSVEPASLIGRPAILGIDLANTQDLAAAVLIAPTRDFFAEVKADEEGRVVIGDVAGAVDVLCWTWCPEARVREQTKRGIKYDVWVRSGHLIATEGNTIHKHAIRRFIAGLRDQGYWIHEIAYDPAFAADFAQDLQDQHGFTMVPIAQDFRTMTEPCMMLETLVHQRRLRHGNSPVLRFAAGNVIVEKDGGGRMRPSKKKSDPHGKIDPISALVTGLKRLHTLQGLTHTKHEAIIGPQRTTAGMPW